MEGMLVIETGAMEWENGLDVVNHMAPEFGRNLGPAEDVARVYVKYRQKTLRIDPKTTQRLDLIHLDPGYGDLTDAYHDSVEECLFLAGECDLSGEGHFVAGDYFWRPPGWIHSARTTPGFEALLMLEGVSDGDRSGPVSRRIRPAHEAGTNALTADHEEAIGPRGWVRCLHTDLVAWQPGSAFARSQGRLEDFDLDHATFKVLSSNSVSGAQSLLVRLGPGYGQKAAGRNSAALEWFVLEGGVDLGTREAKKGTYVYRPPGLAEPPMRSDGGALLFMKTKGWLDFATVSS
jgi:ChrR-like protein with cupin domain